MIVRNLSAVAGAIAGVALDAWRIVAAKWAALEVSSTQGVVADLRWTDSVVTTDAAACTTASVTLNGLVGGVFGGLRIGAGSGAAAISIGATVACANVAFVDLSLTGVPAGQTGVLFDDATA